MPGSDLLTRRLEQIRSGSVLLAYIPSPSSRFLVDWGPLHVRWYGLLLALGIAAGVLEHQIRVRRFVLVVPHAEPHSPE